MSCLESRNRESDLGNGSAGFYARARYIAAPKPTYVVTAACSKLVGISRDRVNVRGGAISLGHPSGASGARVLVTLLHAMTERKAKRGLATLCLGGGEAVALLVERP